MSDTTIADAILKKYRENVTSVLLPSAKKIPANIAKIGSFAPQGIKPVTTVVIYLSFSLSKVLVAIIAGTPQPKPINKGINDYTDKPKSLKILYITKATRAM